MITPLKILSDLFLKVEYHRKLTEKYLTKFKQDEYKFVKYLNIDDDITEGEARQQAM